MKVSKMFTAILVLITMFATSSFAQSTFKENHHKNLMVVKSQLWHDGVTIDETQLGEQATAEDEGRVEVAQAYPEELMIPLMNLED
ncbi:MAG: hypothetical protein HN353_04870 [Bdellovibrionales bacterium]|mgnify:CR=1 FL=1|jgi:hypothetical protein|nr:hypothetical protein [Bdellovibrionales bacterium]MBT3527381.1 hypothetical protein [Bdellovibrionales bacterium]MBT7669993.1 hypothetical protein [Bdellovibrionales bacterium]MBT7766367.1 hypothetical protein [Bdellovibrionales bacterium]